MFGEILGEILMWALGLLVWFNVVIWSLVIAINVLTPVIGFVIGFVQAFRS